MNIDLNLSGFSSFVNTCFYAVNPYMVFIGAAVILITTILIAVLYENLITARQKGFHNTHYFVFSAIIGLSILTMAVYFVLAFGFKEPLTTANQQNPYLNFANVKTVKPHGTFSEISLNHHLGQVRVKGTSLDIAKIEWTEPDQVEFKPINKVGQSYLTVAKFLTDRHVQQKNLTFVIKTNETVAEYQDSNGWAKVKATNDQPQKIIFQQQEKPADD